MTSFTNIDPKIFSIPKEGTVFELGHSFHPGIPHHPFHPPFLYSMGRMHHDLFFDKGLSTANDFFASGTHTGTHIDALGHVSCNGHFHGGIEVEANQTKTEGLKVHSITEANPILRRGVLLDLPNLFNVEILEHAYEISAEDLEASAHKQGVKLQKGDTVLIRTGWAKYFSNSRLFLSADKGVPGVTEEAAKWLVSQGMTLTGSDTVAYEKQPTHELPVHRYLLVDKGIHIMEALNLEELAQNNVYEFLFITLPLRINGATGSPIRPIAIV